MKKKPGFFIVGIAVFFVASALIDRLSNVQTPDDASQNAQEKVDAYGLRAADNRWPVIPEAQSVQVGNLTQKNYYLVFDGSGSMGDSNCSNGQSKIAVAKQAVVEFINKIPGDANIGLIVFDGRGSYQRAVLGSSSKQQAISEIGKSTAGGGTPLRSTIEYAYNALTAQAQHQLGYGEYHLVVITDGEASGGEDPRRVVNDMLSHSPVVLHTIGFCIEGGHSLNQQGLAFYRQANNPEQLALGLDSVLAEAPSFKADAFEGPAQ